MSDITNGPLPASARRYLARNYCVVPFDGELSLYTGGASRDFIGTFSPDDLYEFLAENWEAPKRAAPPIPTFTVADLLGDL